MPIKVCSCQCGSTDSLIRGFLQSTGYKDWLTIPIAKGREASLAVLNGVPRSAESEALREYLRRASKWAVIVGWGGGVCRWSDIAHSATKSRIEASLVIETFANVES